MDSNRGYSSNFTAWIIMWKLFVGLILMPFAAIAATLSVGVNSSTKALVAPTNFFYQHITNTDGTITVAQGPGGRLTLSSIGGSGSSTNVVSGRKLYVDEIWGNDSTAKTNSIVFPWRTIGSAVSNAVSGDAIMPGVGRFLQYSNHVKLPHGVHLIGSGRKSTVLVVTGELLKAGAAIAPGSYSLITDLDVECVVEGNVTHAVLGSVTGINPAFTNAVVINVGGISDNDGLYINQTAPCSWTIYNPDITTRYDVMRQGGNSNHFTRIFNPIFLANPALNSDGPITNTFNTGSEATGILNEAGIIEVYGGVITATNGSLGTYAIIANNGALTNITRLVGTRLIAAGTDPTATALIFAGNPATQGFVYVDGVEPAITDAGVGAFQALTFSGIVTVTNAVNRVITLPNIAPAARQMWEGLMLSVYDKGQLADTTNIFITVSGNQRINGVIVTTNISTRGGWMEFVVINTNWHVKSLGSIGTPGGPTNSLQFNSNPSGTFTGSAGMQIVQSNSAAGITSDTLVMNVAGLVNGNNSFINAYGVGSYGLGDFAITSSNVFRWLVKYAGHLVPTFGSNTLDIGTFLLPVRTNYANQGEFKVGLNVGTGNGSVGFGVSGSNFTFQGTPAASNVIYRTPTTATPGVMVAIPVATNMLDMTNVTLAAGQYATYNGTAYVASNLPSAIGSPGVMTQTNFVMNQVYTNTSTTLITVRVFLTQAAENGVSSVAIMWSPAGGVGWANLANAATTTLITGLAGQTTNSMAVVLTNLGSYYFTNTSSGAGNSAGVVTGTGQTTTVGVGERGATGSTTETPAVTNMSVWTETFSGTLANWEVESDATWAISAGKLLAKAGTSAFGRFLKYTNWVTAFQSWTMTCQVTPLTTLNGNYGLGFGIRSANALGIDENLFFQVDFATGENGQVVAWFGTGAFLSKVGGNATALAISVALNDPVNITLSRRGRLFACTASNTVNAQVCQLQHALSITNQTPFGGEPNSGYVSFWSIGGTQEVDNVAFSLNPFWPVTHLIIGDSISSGSKAGTYGNTYSSILRGKLGDGVQVLGNSADYTELTTRALPELNLLSPSNVVIMLGGNDIQLGVAEATWKNNYSNLVARITNSGTIFHAFPTPRDLYDLTPLVKFLSTNYSRSSLIDTFNPLKDGLGTYTLRSDCDSGDGTHPGSAGHSIVAEIIANKLKGQ